MEFIEENIGHKKQHHFSGTIITILIFLIFSFIVAYFAQDFAPVADRFVNKVFASAGKDITCTFFYDYSCFAKGTVETVSNFIEAIKENFGKKNDEIKNISPVIFTCAAKSPVNSENVTSNFGDRINPISNKAEKHTGIDIAAGYGEEIMAAWPGNIYETGEDEIYGKYIVVRHSKDFFTKYCHLSEVVVNKDDFVLVGEEIGKVGDSGWATGSHLHFEVIVEGNYVDPRECLDIC